jgi:adenylosuccinate lyase
MNFSPLQAISPIDGRYRKQTEALSNYFSEYALIKARVHVEVEYLIALADINFPQLKKFSDEQIKSLRNIVNSFTERDAQKIKDTEKITNHDVKAVEYFVKERLEELSLGNAKEFVHFGLTSQDINNTAAPLLTKQALAEVIFPAIENLILKLTELAQQWKNIPMLAHTHGQPASPTLLGKEIQVFVYRLQQQLNDAKKIKHAAKFGGATGNFNAHHVAYPNVDWIKFGNYFVVSLGLARSPFTTQIEHYDYAAALFDNCKRINTILIDLCRDIWAYISMSYFTQTVSKNEVGSSAMPHKVNPIDFENAEGNLGIANALFEHLSAKLPISRLQRDLTDSTVLRNVGVPFAHNLIALTSLQKGLNKISINKNAIENDLTNNVAVIAEAIQTILRRENYPNPYESLKELTRTGEKITQEKMQAFIASLKINEDVRQELLKITPFNYTGINQL